MGAKSIDLELETLEGSGRHFHEARIESAKNSRPPSITRSMSSSVMISLSRSGGPISARLRGFENVAIPSSAAARTSTC